MFAKESVGNATSIKNIIKSLKELTGLAMNEHKSKLSLVKEKK